MIKKEPELIDSCTACSACYSICPNRAISMREDREGFYYPSVQPDKCTSCELCVSTCPELNRLGEETGATVRSAYYGWHKSEKIRKESSSGGMFTAITEEKLQNNGVVFGAIYDKVLKSVHHSSTDQTDLQAFRKSKYVQSAMGETFKEVRAKLAEDRPVLFVGTPCQVSGLKSFLRKDIPHLLTCDFVCHGVPPMKLLNDHLSLLEKKLHSEIINIDFRPKTLGWSIHQLKLCLDGEKEHCCHGTRDAYFKAFFQNLSLRKSCYQCSYSNQQHSADITLADFWGYKRFNSEINDEKGLSLIIANTAKGVQSVENLTSASYFPVEWKYASYVFHARTEKNYNRNLRDAFFYSYSTMGWKKCASTHNLNHSVFSRTKRRIAKILRLMEN